MDKDLIKEITEETEMEINLPELSKLIEETKSNLSKTNPQKEKIEKPKKEELHENIFLAMTYHPISKLPEFPARFYAIEDTQGVRRPIVVDKETSICSNVNKEKVISTIQKYCKSLGRGQKEFLYSPKDAENCYTLWIRTTEAILESEIKAVREKSEPGLCWGKLDFDIPKEKQNETPVWDELMSRMSNVEAFKAFTGSIMFEEADTQQYLWLYGEGRNGKGAYGRFLFHLLKNAYTPQKPPRKGGDPFWNYGLLNKRLVHFADIEEHDYVKTGGFKSQLGGDTQRVEQKYGPTLSVRFKLKQVFDSNKRPDIGTQTSDLRRAIFCDVEQLPAGTTLIPEKEYDEMLWKEAPDFIADCISVYKKLCPRHGEIPVDTALLLEEAEHNEEEYQSIFDQFFISEKDHPELKGTLSISASKFQNIIRSDETKLNNKHERKNFKTWVMRKYSGKPKRKVVGKNTQATNWTYIGIAEKDMNQREQYDQEVLGEEKSRF